ncbi:MAG: DUF5681 domain-containing protein [Planctomycetota bacterium]
MNNQPPDYVVGYGRPPKQHRFQPGQSGNPNGRPKKPKDLPSIVASELKKKVRVTEQGEARFVTRLEALAMRLVEQALKGDHRALKYLVQLNDQAVDPDDFEVGTDAQAILNDFLDKYDQRSESQV